MILTYFIQHISGSNIGCFGCLGLQKDINNNIEGLRNIYGRKVIDHLEPFEIMYIEKVRELFSSHQTIYKCFGSKEFKKIFQKVPLKSSLGGILTITENEDIQTKTIYLESLDKHKNLEDEGGRAESANTKYGVIGLEDRSGQAANVNMKYPDKDLHLDDRSGQAFPLNEEYSEKNLNLKEVETEITSSEGFCKCRIWEDIFLKRFQPAKVYRICGIKNNNGNFECYSLINSECLQNRLLVVVNINIFQKCSGKHKGKSDNDFWCIISKKNFMKYTVKYKIKTL